MHKPWLILSDIGQCKCRTTYEHTPRPMHASLGFFCISLANVACQICTCHARYVHALFDAFNLWQMLLAQSAQALADCACRLADVHVSKLMHTRHELCVHILDDVTYRCLTSLPRYAQTTSDLWRPCLMLPTIGRHRLDDACSPRLMSPNWCAHDMAIVCMCWMVFPAFG